MFTIIFLYILLPAIQVFLYLSNNFTFDLIEKMNYITSITSLHWMLSNVLIASKVPFLQNLIPYDRRVKTHIIFSSSVLFLLLYHSLYKIVLGYSIGVFTILLGVLFILIFIVSIVWIPVPGFIKFRKKIISISIFKNLLNYEFSKKFHVFTQPILGILIFIHIYKSEIVYDVPKISTYIFLILFILSYSLFLLSKTSIFRRSCSVVSIEKIQDIVFLVLKLSRPLRYRSGQFTFLGYKNTNGNIEEHPFSFLSVGGNSSKNVSFGIKILGDFTASLTDLKVDDRLWIRGTYGNFRPNLRSSKPITLIGSGIGIVPLLSIFKELYNTGSRSDINVFIAVNNKEEILDLEILELADKEMGNVKINYLIYQEDGLLFSADYFSNKIIDPLISNYYICSSPGVRKIIVESLRSLNVKKTQIHYEAFSF